MRIAELQHNLNHAALGATMHELASALYPICRSITGDGLRTTLRLIGEQIPLQLHEVASGTAVFDWTVPNEWNIRDAFIKNRHGQRVIDFRRSNLHVLNYSTPIHAWLSLAELKPHLYADAEHPDWIPYRTSYYNPNWGFCLSQRQLDALDDDEYEVCVDATLTPGALSYGEALLPGATDEEVLISCHACHPSLANDNLSGIALATTLATLLSEVERRYTYRFLFIPGTIGSITWLARNEAVTPRIRHGLVLTCVGDNGPLTYKRSRRGDAPIDRAAAAVLGRRERHTIQEFSPYGYDERQFCSPGFDLPVGCLMRTPYGQFPEYHTSADNLTLLRPEALADSLAAVLDILEIVEGDRIYLNLNPKCEPQLGKRGLYGAIGGRSDAKQFQLALLWVLNQSDGRHSLLEIAERSGIAFGAIRAAADALIDAALLAEMQP